MVSLILGSLYKQGSGLLIRGFLSGDDFLELVRRRKGRNLGVTGSH